MKLKNQRVRPRNERVSNTRQRRQQHLLDVRVRSHKATQHRNRRVLVLSSKIALGLALVTGAFFGVRFGAKRLFFENPDYQLSQIQVQTMDFAARPNSQSGRAARRREHFQRESRARPRPAFAAAAGG